MDIPDGSVSTSSRTRHRKSIEQQIAEQEARLKELRRKARSEERKARTKRLIETGAVVESATGTEYKTPEQRQALLSVLTRPVRLPDGGTTCYADMLATEVRNELTRRGGSL